MAATAFFVRSRDGARLACTRTGSGPALVQTPAWLSHLEHDGCSPMAGPLQRALARRHSVVRYDPRGCGRSDWLQPGGGIADWVQDLEAVVQRVAAPRFALLGVSQGAAIAIAYAARHPERVSRLVLHGGYARGALVRDPDAAAEAGMLVHMAELGWGRADEAFRQLFTTQLIPGGSRTQQAQFNELQRLATSADNAAQWMRGFDRIDIEALLPQVSCPTLVLHSRHDRRVPFEEGRLLASGLPDAEFVSIDSGNHLLLDTEAAWPRWLAHVNEFLACETTASNHSQVTSLLTARQRDVIELVAQGRCNGQIAQTLGLSERTVRNQIAALIDKLSVENRSQAIVRLHDSGFGTGTITGTNAGNGAGVGHGARMAPSIAPPPVARAR